MVVCSKPSFVAVGLKLRVLTARLVVVPSFPVGDFKLPVTAFRIQAFETNENIPKVSVTLDTIFCSVSLEATVNSESFVVSIGVTTGVFGDARKELPKVDKGSCANSFGLRVCNFETTFIPSFEEND